MGTVTPEKFDFGGNPAPEMPAGGWLATCTVNKSSKPTKNGDEMAFIEWKTTEALSDDNEQFVGGRVTDIFIPKKPTDRFFRFFHQQVKALCDALSVEAPEVSIKNMHTLSAWDAFFEAITGQQTTIYTSVTTDKSTGAPRVRVSYTAPAGTPKGKSDNDEDEDEDDEEEEAPAPVVVKKKMKKKAA